MNLDAHAELAPNLAPNLALPIATSLIASPSVQPSLHRSIRLSMLLVCAAFGFCMTCNSIAQSSAAESKPAESKATETKPPDLYQVIYLTNLTDQNTANDIQTDLRNMLPRTKVYYVPSQSALTLRGSAEDIQLAQKIVADIDKPRKSYRLTYTITEGESGKAGSAQHFAIVVLLGSKTSMKQGSRVPIVTGSYEADTSKANTQVQYLDIGLNIEASLDGSLDGLRLRTKIEQSSPAEEKSGVGMQDPVIRQSVLESTSAITLGKRVVLGSLDVPGTSKHQEIEVVSELVQ